MSRTMLVFIAALTIALCAVMPSIAQEPTPPIMPQVVETQLPPPVTLPAPEKVPDDVPSTPLTATEAALIALHYHPSITVAQLGVIASQARLQQAKAGLSPTMGVSGGYSALSVDGENRGNGFSTGATLRQLLFDYNHTRDLVQQATLQEHSARANLTRAQSDLVFQVKQAYYNYAQALRLIAVNEANLRNRQEHLAQAQARVKAGVGLPIDVVRAETAVEEAILQLNLARNTASVARVLLAQIMGLDPRTPIDVGEANEPVPALDDVNALVQTALKQRPEIHQAQANIEASGYALSAAKTSNKPAVVGSLGYGLQDPHFPPATMSLSLGLAVQWNPFDGGLTKGKITEAQANKDSAVAQLASANLTVMTDVSQAYLNLVTAQQRVTTANAQVANAQEAVRLAQGRYQAGLGIFLDVLDAQATLVSAQTNQVNAQSAINQAGAALAHAMNSDPALAANQPAP